MDLEELRESWDHLGEVDPMWAILFVPDRKGNRWDVDEFFASGRTDLAAALAHVDSLDIPLVRGRALDFGCGVGRITQPLADEFEQVDGVDIAPSMINLANQFNKHPDTCHYRVNDQPDLRSFDDGSFDFVYSVLVLQHIEQRYVEAYLAEFVRLLKVGGVLLFTLPSHESWTPLGRVYRWAPRALLNLYRRRRYGYDGVMELHGIHRDDVEALLRRAGATIVDVQPDPLAGTVWHSFRYVVTKAGAR